VTKRTIAVIGCGYWGPRLIRNFQASDRWDLRWVCDRDPARLGPIKEQYPSIETLTDYRALLEGDRVEAVAIATPVDTHHEIARQFLWAGVHTWVEKPLASDRRQAEELIELAEETGALLHVDHTFVYTPAVRRMRKLIDDGELGEFYYFDSVRVNLGLFQHDVNVLWDLAPHDISILRYLVDKEPVAVSAIGRAHIDTGGQRLENVAYLTVSFEDESIAHFHVNWLSPVKLRLVLLGGSRRMVVWNDLEPSEKVKVYDAGVEVATREDVYRTLIQYRTGDMWAPRVENAEALGLEVRHFAECIDSGRPTDTSGEDGLYVVKVLEAADRSLREGGSPVEIPR
jgi:predicted dehydrogenase